MIDGFSLIMLALFVFFVVRNAKNEILQEIRKDRIDSNIKKS